MKRFPHILILGIVLVLLLSFSSVIAQEGEPEFYSCFSNEDCPSDNGCSGNGVCLPEGKCRFSNRNDGTLCGNGWGHCEEQLSGISLCLPNPCAAVGMHSVDDHNDYLCSTEDGFVYDPYLEVYCCSERPDVQQYDHCFGNDIVSVTDGADSDVEECPTGGTPEANAFLFEYYLSCEPDGSSDLKGELYGRVDSYITDPYTGNECSDLSFPFVYEPKVCSCPGAYTLVPRITTANAVETPAAEIPNPLYVIDYDSDETSCEQFECGGGVFDGTLLGGENACCGDDSTDDPDTSELFCEGDSSGHTCSVGNLGERDYLNNAGCCGDDFVDVSGNLIAAPSNDPNDCGQIVSGSALCSISRYGTSAEWYKANSGYTGEILYVPCKEENGRELVYTDSQYYSCGNFGNGAVDFSGATVEDSSLYIGKNNALEGDECPGNGHYFCYDSQKGKNSIGYCGPDSKVTSVNFGRNSEAIPAGGKRYREGESLVFPSTNEVFYCVQEFTDDCVIEGGAFGKYIYRFESDLDTIDEKGDTSGDACNRAEHPLTGLDARYSWTGSSCCSEEDDRRFYDEQSPFYESYNEDAEQNTGACFNGLFQPNKDGALPRVDANSKNGFVYYPLLSPEECNGPNCLDKHSLGKSGSDFHHFKELFTMNGTIHGCNIADEKAGGARDVDYEGSLGAKGYLSNDFLLELRNYPNPGGEGSDFGPLIVDHTHSDRTCAMVGTLEEPNQYFCSYQEIWVASEGENRTHLSYVGWQDDETEGIQVAECCLPDQCWDGTQCTDSVHEDPFAEPYEGAPSDGDFGYRCMEGEWVNAGTKKTWDGALTGICKLDSQCLVDPNGDATQTNVSYFTEFGSEENPACINDGDAILDHYCENGEWTSRTKFVALTLLEQASHPYTLFCDEYQNVLNYVNYQPPGSLSFIPSGDDLGLYYFEQNNLNQCINPATGEYIPCVNNICVLRDSEKTMVGVSLNHHTQSTQYNLLEVFELGGTACDSAVGFDQFVACESETFAESYYNDEKKILLYSKHGNIQSTQLPGSLSFFQLFQSILVQPFLQPLIHSIVQAQHAHAFAFLETTSKDMSRVYLAESEEGRKVFGYRERIFNQPLAEGGLMSEYFAIDYLGFSANLCDAITNELPAIYCEEEDSTYHVVHLPTANPNAAFERDWIDLTARLRVQ